MAMAERTAVTAWEGDLAHGAGAINAGSGALMNLAVTWASRTERSDGRTSPEELIAAAHSSCFSMALAHGLTEAGHPPERLEVRATVTLDAVDGAPTVTTSELHVTGHVPGLEQLDFSKAATDAGKNCPISRALTGVEISVEAVLENGSN